MSKARDRRKTSDESDLASGEGSIDVELKSPRLLAREVVRTRSATSEGVVRAVESSVVESAVSSPRLAVLVVVSSVEVLASAEAVLTREDCVSLVGTGLGPGVVGADLRVVCTGEDLGAHPVLLAADGLGAAVGAGLPLGD